jgi:HEAT repeat protein
MAVWSCKKHSDRLPPCPADASPKEKEVFKWLNKYPLSTDVPRRYATFSDWIDAGRRIQGIEDVLIDFYERGAVPGYGDIIVDALGELGSKKSEPLLIRILEDKKAVMRDRLSAIRALGYIGGPAAVETLCKVLTSEIELTPPDFPFYKSEWGVAACALRMIGDARAVPALKGVLNDPNIGDVEKECILSALKQLEGK